jgi:hypothetical protein
MCFASTSVTMASRRNLALHLVVGEKRLRDGARVGEAGGLDEDGVELDPCAWHEAAEDADEIAADGAADAAVVHLEEFLLGLLDDELVVDADFAEFVFDDGDFLGFPCCSVRMRLRSVVLPAPRKPVRTVTGNGENRARGRRRGRGIFEFRIGIFDWGCGCGGCGGRGRLRGCGGGGGSRGGGGGVGSEGFGAGRRFVRREGFGVGGVGVVERNAVDVERDFQAAADGVVADAAEKRRGGAGDAARARPRRRRARARRRGGGAAKGVRGAEHESERRRTERGR